MQRTRLCLRLGGLVVFIYCAMTLDGRLAPYFGRFDWNLLTVCYVLRANLGWAILFVMGLVAMFRSAWAARLIWHGLEAGLCPSCGYDRRGTAGPCPECGAKAE